ncbi:MAG: DUF4493 domain-containing protein [Muribaculaceae bacterium]|nr:DUF4493 domain-containing protein [Muribaculaceae bacterium]
MKKIYNIMMLALLSLVTLASCSKDDPFPATPEESAQGQVSLKKMLVDITNEEVVMRSSIDVAEFIVSIEGESGVVITEAYKDMPEVVTLPVGNYKVCVKSHEVKDAAWDEPYFYGEQSFKVEKNKVTEVNTVVCRLANVRVTIVIHDLLARKSADDVNVNVLLGENTSLDFSKTETRSGYFKYVEGSSTMVATFTGTVQNNYEENFRTYVDVAPGNHYIITYRLQGPNGDVPDNEGYINHGVNVSASVTSVNMTVNVETEDDILEDDERPEEGGEGPIDPPADQDLPTVEAVAPITFDAPNVVDANSEVTINVQSHHEDGINEFKVTINSEMISGLLEAQLGTSELDFINPASETVANFIKELNLVEGDVKGCTDNIEIKITGFMGMLSILGPSSHDFVITVGDANGRTVKTLTLVIEK